MEPYPTRIPEMPRGCAADMARKDRREKLEDDMGKYYAFAVPAA